VHAIKRTNGYCAARRRGSRKIMLSSNEFHGALRNQVTNESIQNRSRTIASLASMGILKRFEF
jgi:hypothetical protein